MAFAAVNIGTNSGAVGASLAVTVPAGVSIPAGSVICVGVSELSTTFSTAGSVTSTVVGSSVFTSAMSAPKNNTITSGVGGFFYESQSAAISSGSLITYNRNISATPCAMSAFYITGASTVVDPYDLGFAKSTTGTGTTPTVTSGSPVRGNYIAVGLIAASSEATITNPSTFATPFTLVTRVSAAVGGGNTVQASTAALTFNPTLGTSQPFVAFIAGFRAPIDPMTAASGSYVVTDNNFSLKEGSKLSAQAGFYALTENDLTITLFVPSTDFTLSIGTGYYVLTDESLTLLKQSEQGVQTVAYSLAGEALNALKTSKLSGSAGSYTLAGEVLTLKAVHREALQSGTYSLAGEPLALRAGRRDALQAGLYSLAGGSLTLQGPFTGAFFLTIGTGTYTVAGQSEQALKGSQAALQTGSYALTEKQITEAKAFLLSLNPGSYLVTGKPVTLTATGQQTITIIATPIMGGSEKSTTLKGKEASTILIAS